jgi:hypothetical protein
MVADRELILGTSRCSRSSRCTTSSRSSTATCSPGGPADGVRLTANVQLLATPGHTPQDVTTIVGTADDVVALTHLW